MQVTRVHARNDTQTAFDARPRLDGAPRPRRPPAARGEAPGGRGAPGPGSRLREDVRDGRPSVRPTGALAQEQRKKNRKGRRWMVAADKAYDTKDFVRRCRELRVTPHVAMATSAHRRSAIDGRTSTRSGYRVSTTKRLLIEKSFGCLKTAGGMRKSRFRGRSRTPCAVLVGLASLNLLRIAKLTHSGRGVEGHRAPPNAPSAAACWRRRGYATRTTERRWPRSSSSSCLSPKRPSPSWTTPPSRPAG